MFCTKSKPSSNRNKDDCSWNVWPIVRNNFQRIAYEAFKSNESDKSVLYDSMALSCGYVGGMLNIEQLNRTIDHSTLCKTVDMQKNTDRNNKLIDFLSGAMRDALNSVNVATTVDNDKDQQRFDELCTKCAELPNEWNVVQLSQMYSGYNGYATTKDIYTSDAPIKITLFRDSLSEQRNNRPIFIVLDLFETGEKSVSKVKTF